MKKSTNASEIIDLFRKAGIQLNAGASLLEIEKLSKEISFCFPKDFIHFWSA